MLFEIDTAFRGVPKGHFVLLASEHMHDIFHFECGFAEVHWVCQALTACPLARFTELAVLRFKVRAIVHHEAPMFTARNFADIREEEYKFFKEL